MLNAQRLPYGKPKYFEIGTNEELQQITVSIPSAISQIFFENCRQKLTMASSPPPTFYRNLFPVPLLKISSPGWLSLTRQARRGWGEGLTGNEKIF